MQLEGGKSAQWPGEQLWVQCGPESRLRVVAVSRVGFSLPRLELGLDALISTAPLQVRHGTRRTTKVPLVTRTHVLLQPESQIPRHNRPHLRQPAHGGGGGSHNRYDGGAAQAGRL